MERFTLTTTDLPRKERRLTPPPTLTVDRAPREPRRRGVTLEPVADDLEWGSLPWARARCREIAARGAGAAFKRLTELRGRIAADTVPDEASLVRQSNFQPKATRAAWLAERLAEHRAAVERMERSVEQEYEQTITPMAAPDGAKEGKDNATLLWTFPTRGGGATFFLTVKGVGTVATISVGGDPDIQARLYQCLAEIYGEYLDGERGPVLTVTP